MRRMSTRQDGQSTVEYALLVGIIVAAALAMQVYVKRGTMGKMRDAADQIGEQFEPLTTTHTYTNAYTSSGRTEHTTTDGKVVSTIGSAGEVRTKTGSEEVTEGLDGKKLF